jgi:FkbM family methyltransferase
VNDRVPLVADLVYDVGMHRGEDTAFYLAKGYRVAAFEANPDLVEACRQRFAQEIAAGRVTIFDGAITDGTASSVRFFKHPISAWGTTSEHVAARNTAMGSGVDENEAVEVPAVDFADALRRTGMPSFMKIDIEGADETCLQALLSFDVRPRSISIESAVGAARLRSRPLADWAKLKEEFSVLERLGYDRFAVVPQDVISGQEIVTPTVQGDQLRFRFEHGSGPFGSDIGPWVDRSAAVAEYRRILLREWLFGAEGLVRRTRPGRVLHRRVLMRFVRPPAWFDTHAARSGDWSPPTFAGDPGRGFQTR